MKAVYWAAWGAGLTTFTLATAFAVWGTIMLTILVNPVFILGTVVSVLVYFAVSRFVFAPSFAWISKQ